VTSARMKLAIASTLLAAWNLFLLAMVLYG
jgi:hypothetical protein